MVPNELTLDEAKAICRCWNFGGKVSMGLHDLAAAIVKASQPIVVYKPIDWYENDGDDKQFELDDTQFELDEEYLKWVKSVDEAILEERL